MEKKENKCTLPEDVLCLHIHIKCASGNCEYWQPIHHEENNCPQIVDGSKQSDTLESAAKEFCINYGIGNGTNVSKQFMIESLVEFAQSPESFQYHLKSDAMKEILHKFWIQSLKKHFYNEGEDGFTKFYQELTKTK